MINFMSSTKIENGSADFRLLDKKVIEVLRNNINEYHLFLRGIIFWVGFKQFALSYTPGKRHAGVTKYSFMKMMSFALNGITSFSVKPLRIGVFIGMMTTLLGMLYGIYALYISIFKNIVVPGWTSVIITVLFFGGIQMIMLGIIGEYLGKLFFEVKKRPHYIVRETNINS